MPGVGHMLNMENPALFNQLVLDFLQEKEAVTEGHRVDTEGHRDFSLCPSLCVTLCS
jgi:hypothetical protein